MRFTRETLTDVLLQRKRGDALCRLCGDRNADAGIMTLAQDTRDFACPAEFGVHEPLNRSHHPIAAPSWRRCPCNAASNIGMFAHCDTHIHCDMLTYHNKARCRRRCPPLAARRLHISLLHNRPCPSPARMAPPFSQRPQPRLYKSANLPGPHAIPLHDQQAGPFPLPERQFRPRQPRPRWRRRDWVARSPQGTGGDQPRRPRSTGRYSTRMITTPGLHLALTVPADATAAWNQPRAKRNRMLSCSKYQGRRRDGKDRTETRKDRHAATRQAQAPVAVKPRRQPMAAAAAPVSRGRRGPRRRRAPPPPAPPPPCSPPRPSPVHALHPTTTTTTTTATTTNSTTHPNQPQQQLVSGVRSERGEAARVCVCGAESFAPNIKIYLPSSHEPIGSLSLPRLAPLAGPLPCISTLSTYAEKTEWLSLHPSAQRQQGEAARCKLRQQRAGHGPDPLYRRK
jgi:hypothetical protein